MILIPRCLALFLFDYIFFLYDIKMDFNSGGFTYAVP